MFVTDRFGSGLLADLGVVPPARVLPARFTGQSEPPFAETGFQKILIELCQITHLADAELMHISISDLADAGHFAHVQRREELRFEPWYHPDYAVRFGLVGTDLGDHARRRDPDRAVEVGRVLHAVMQDVRGA